MAEPWFAFVESNTTGSGRQFCQTVRARGMRPVVLTDRPDRYPFLAADAVETIVCDTADPEAVYEACARLARTRSTDGQAGLAGIWSSSEYFVATAAGTAHRLGLPAPDAAAIERCRHKDRQRQLLAAAGIPTPRWAVATTADQARAAARRIGFPVVVKPTTGSGSLGVRLCPDAATVERWAAVLLAATVNERGLPVPRRVLVEEYASGPEFSVETFADTTIEVVRKHVGEPPHFVEIGHDVPARVAPPTRDRLCAAARRAVAALGVDWGAAHTELRLTERGPLVIEVNPRLAGGMIPTLLALATGVDLVDAVIARSSGRPAAPSPPSGRYAAIRFLVATESGPVAGVDGVPAALAQPGVHAVEVTAAPGTRIELTHSFRDRVGYVIAVGASGDEAGDRADRAHAQLRLRMAE
ncbi:MAG TPA: ATP-grasp domain-containing protein [Micromonosporaceae bacterium]